MRWTATAVASSAARHLHRAFSLAPRFEGESASSASGSLGGIYSPCFAATVPASCLCEIASCCEQLP